VPEDAELADAIDKLGEDETDEHGKPVNAMDGTPKPIPPVALTVKNVVAVVGEDFEKWLADRKNSRQISHRFVVYVGALPPREGWACGGFPAPDRPSTPSPPSRPPSIWLPRRPWPRAARRPCVQSLINYEVPLLDVSDVGDVSDVSDTSTSPLRAPAVFLGMSGFF
jgi:hypothetical protein